jgi:hypothetical protein
MFSINATTLKETNSSQNSFIPLGTEQLSFTINVDADNDVAITSAIKNKLMKIRGVCDEI